jgi:cellulose synthase/poly-beta-1,6-N-acetylglucosamine synthase-like glycosyltransferase
MEWVLLLSVVLLAYIYAGYPLLLRLLVWARGARPIQRADGTPTVSLVISAYNEAVVIRGKIENSLALDYPREALHVAVISDASSDGTDDIVREYAHRGVTLYRQDERVGKTAGLNATLPRLSSEVVVFSDANAMYEPDALRKLVRNFADPEVGCVTGEARYLPGGEAAADRGERVYWDYEIQVKRLETELGSMVGGDGAIYAIRRQLWQTLPENAINDFLNPLQIVVAGWRGVYEPEAVCFEESAGKVKAEYRRRIRIVSRSWRAVFQARGVLNPFRMGLFTWCLISHKMLRWSSGFIVLAAAVAAVTLSLDELGRWSIPAGGAVVLVAVVLAATPWGRRWVSMLLYFGVINLASAVGLVKGSLGRVSGVWSTPRAAEATAGKVVRVGSLFLGAVAAVVAAAVLFYPFVDYPLARVVYWVSLLALGYVYVGYPVLLALLRAARPIPVRKAALEPRVCLLVAANDEGAVIESKLRNALELDYPADKLEIVVASDGSVDETNAIVRRFGPRVRLLELSPRRGKIGAINRAMASIDSDVVVFSDANTFLDRDAVRALVANFADEGVGGVSGDVTLVGSRASLGSSEDLYYLYERWVQRAESEIGSMIGADGAMYAIRTRLFEAPADDTILDDMAIPMAVTRRGYRVVFEADARAHEEGVETAMEEFARKARVVAGAIQFLTRRDSAVPAHTPQVAFSLVSHKALRWLSPVFATLLFSSTVALATASNQFAAIAMAQGILVIAGLSGCVPRLRKIPPVSLAHYFLLVQAAAAVGFARGLSGRQSVLWRRFIRIPPKHSAAA